MKAVFYSVETKSEPWVSDAKQTYEKKLRPFFPFEIESIKSASLERSEAEAKKKAEADKILKLIKPNDYLILFDEAGKAFANSEVFAQQFGRVMESSPSRLVFLIGGALVSMNPCVAARGPCGLLAPLPSTTGWRRSPLLSRSIGR